MGFQGQLSSVNLTDIFQTLSMNRQSGTLVVTAGDEAVQVYFNGGLIAACTAAPVNGQPFLLQALINRSLLDATQAAAADARAQSTGQNLRDVLLADGTVPEVTLDEVCGWCLEESLCPIFEWKDGEFAFHDGVATTEIQAYDSISLGVNCLQTQQLVLEASRREDEWKRIREVLPDTTAYFVVDNDGRANLRNVDSDPEMLKVLRYLDGRHTVDQIATAVGVSRFDAFAIVAQLVLANIARPRTPQEAVDDALELRASGDLAKARELLELTMQQFNVPEVLRPLAEISIQLNQVPRAVELYLELIQRAQDAGDLQQAIADLDTIITLSPADPDLHYDRAQVLAELGRGDDAAQAYVAAAQHYLGTRNLEQATDACHRAKNLQPRAPEPHRYLAKAYLAEGQTENAVVEYKSLWHALLSHERPRKAIDTLRQILDQDCKFAAVKEQVLSHAQSSEAVKTGSAMRILAYALLAMVVVVGAVFGWRFIQNEVIGKHGQTKLQALNATITNQMEELHHAALVESFQDLASRYSAHPEIVADCEKRIAEIKSDAERRARAELETAKALMASGKLDDARKALIAVRSRFPGTQGATDAEQGLVLVRQQEEDRLWQNLIGDADALWQNDRWDEALIKLKELAARTDAPTAVRSELSERSNRWTTILGSAQELFRRAERIERLGRKGEAMVAYQRAMQGDGESFRARARERLVLLEKQFAEELAKRMQEAFERADDQNAFIRLAELRQLAQNSTSTEVADMVATLELPFTVRLDSRFAVLKIKRKGQPDLTVTAPADGSGPWTRVIRYPNDQSWSIEVQRAGFTTQTLIISAEARRSQATIALKRGPLWQTDLNAIPTTAPVASGKFLLVGTNKATLEVIDPGLGTARPIIFTDSVSEIAAPPQVHQNRAYTVVDDKITAIDIDTRTPTWTWPTQGTTTQLGFHPQSLWVQEHELIQGRTLVVAGTSGSSGTLITLGASGTHVEDYPPTALEAGVTGGPLVDHFNNYSTLYVPAGQQIIAFDATSPSEHSAPRKLFSVNTRGDVVGRLVRAQIGKRPVILATDASGIVLGLDADPEAERKVIASWSLEGSPTHGTTVNPSVPIAYVAVSEGRVLFLDLANPGQLLKRFPPQGSLGPLPGPPVVGRNGVYIADANGVLYCIDAVTGTERWRADLGSPVSTGILAVDGRIFVPTRGGNLLCFEEGTIDP